MKNLSLKYLPLSLLCIYLLRSLILNMVTLNDAFIIAILAGLTAFYEMSLESKRIKELYKRMDELNTRSKQQDDVIQGIKDSLSAFRVSSSIKNVR